MAHGNYAVVFRTPEILLAGVKASSNAVRLEVFGFGGQLLHTTLTIGDFTPGNRTAYSYNLTLPRLPPDVEMQGNRGNDQVILAVSEIDVDPKGR